MDDKERMPYPEGARPVNPNDPAMKCVYFGPQPIPQILAGYAGPRPCNIMDGISDDGTRANGPVSTPSDAKKPKGEPKEGCVFCPCCGAEVMIGQKFCQECGRKMDEK